MTFRAKALQLAALAALAMCGTSCTAKYQDMVRDRDETIRDLEGKLSMERSKATGLRRDLAQAQNDLAAAKATRIEPAVARTKPKPKNELADWERALRGAGIDEQAVKARYRHGRVSIGIANRVTFGSGSTKVSSEGENILKRLAGVLKAQLKSGNRIYVEGHTDADPIRKTKNKFRSNRHLSAERADSVAAFLTRSGVPADRVVILGFGPNDPVSRSDKALNRRVEIVLAN